MKIFAPINTLDEVEALISAGADELFCGIVPKEWQEKYSNAFSVNRRHLAVNQLSDVNELNKIIEASHKKSVPVFIALNNLFYLEQQSKSLIDYLKQLEDLGADGVIIASIPLIEMCTTNTKLNISISGEALPINSESVRLYKEMGAKRITFPRDITLEEMSQIIKANPQLEYEAFILRERCAYCGGNCFTSHGMTKTNWCGENWEKRIASLDHSLVPFDTYDRFQKTLSYYKLWRGVDFLDITDKFNNDPRTSECGMCGLKKMKAMGVLSLKIVGRGIPTLDKVQHICILKKALEICEETDDYNKFTEKMIELKASPGYCESKAKCYYRDF